MSTFTSNFAPHIEAMLEWRTSLGHSPRDMTNAMAGFDRFCASHYPGETGLTAELATTWCRDTATGTWGADLEPRCPRVRQVPSAGRRGGLHRAVRVDLKASPRPAAPVQR